MLLRNLAFTLYIRTYKDNYKSKGVRWIDDTLDILAGKKMVHNIRLGNATVTPGSQ